MQPRLVALTTAVAALAAPAQDLPAPERYLPARAVIAADIAQGHVPSAAIAVLEDGEVVWAEGLGLACVERAVPATADTIYRLASISKPFTATAAMLLGERGRLDLDAPVNGYLEPPGVVAYRGDAGGITLRRLMNHTAGLPTHWSFFYAGSPPPPRADTIRAYGFAAWAPGTRTNYSNLAFGIVDHVIARTARRPFREFLVAELCDPLGMAHTDVGVRPGREPQAAVGYARDVAGRFVSVVDYGFDHDGASAVRSSARDLMRFARLFVDGGELDGRRLLAAATVRAMREPRAADAGSSFGIGWSVGDERGTPALRHTGGMPGVSTVLHVYPERRAALAVLTNGADRAVTGRALVRIQDALLGPGSPGAAPPAPQVSGDAPRGAFAGLVVHPDGPLPLDLTIADDGRPSLRLGDASVREFRHQEVGGPRVRLRFDGLVRTTRAFHGTPELDLELELGAGGLSGILSAVADGVFRLPHFVELAPVEAKPDGALRVVSYNVLVGFQDHAVGAPYLPGAQRRLAVSAWLAALAADVVALQEMNGYTEQNLRRDAAAWLHPHAAMLKHDGYPVALTSRWPIEVVERRTEGLHHGFLHCRTAGIDFVVVHVVPMPGLERKLAEVEAIADAYRGAVGAGRPAVVLGDFNGISPADADRFSDEALARYRKWGYALADGRPSETSVVPLLAAGAVDVLSPDAASLPLPRIDFVFASPDLAAKSLACRWRCEPELLRRSDHPPVVADFAWAKR